MMLFEGCYDCHENQPGIIHVNRTNIVNAIEEYGIEIAENKDTMDASTLEKARSLHRDAQFYWDFVFSENSDGYHNSALAEECLDTSQAFINEANALF